MKKVFISISIVLFAVLTQARPSMNLDSSKASFYNAFDAIKNMLEGKDSLNYEKAVFITENAYHNNFFSYTDFKKMLDLHTGIIKTQAEHARKKHEGECKSKLPYYQKMFRLNTINGAIFNYITDTTFFNFDSTLFHTQPFSYTSDDPYGSTRWENTQVLNLLLNEEKKGNCYALSTFFKLFSDRLKSDARLTLAPHHIYIQTRNEYGEFWNVELATKTFPGDGSIQTLTYTTKTSIMNGMAQRMLSDKEAVALNLIYLAKGFQHKFNDNTDDFLLKCAELAFKHDTLSLNALLLKGEIMENKLLHEMKQNKVTTLSKARTNPKTRYLLASYEKQLNNLYHYGYREIPKDIEKIILSKIQHKEDGYITTDKTPNPFKALGYKQRYATLSWGLFDEIHEKADTIQYFHAMLNTKTKKIIELLPFESTDYYKVDPVVFAWSVDPLSEKYPQCSPYQFSERRVIDGLELEGLEKVTYRYVMDNNTGKTKLNKIDVQNIDVQGNKLPFSRHATLNGEESSFTKVYGLEKQAFAASKKEGVRAFGINIEGTGGKGGIFGEGSADPANTGSLTKGELKTTAKILDYTGVGLKVIGYGTIIFDGAGIPLIEAGEILSKTGDAIQAGIDISEGNYGKAALNIGFNAAGYKLGKTIDKSSLTGIDKEIIKTGADLKVDLLKKTTEAVTDEK